MSDTQTTNTERNMDKNKAYFSGARQHSLFIRVGGWNYKCTAAACRTCVRLFHPTARTSPASLAA